jgi:hypothetical protein
MAGLWSTKGGATAGLKVFLNTEDTEVAEEKEARVRISCGKHAGF